MKGLRTLFGLIGLIVSIVMPFMYLIVYLAFLLALYGGNIGDLPWVVTPTMILMPPVLFVASIVGMAARRSKVGAIIAGIFFLGAAGVGIYFESAYYFPNPGVAFFAFFFAVVGLFFFIGGIFQPKMLKSKAEIRAEKARKQAERNGTYVPPYPQQGYPQQGAYQQPVYQQPVYQQPYPQQQTYQQPPATPVYQAPANGWTCPSCGNVNDPNGRFCRSCGGMRPNGVQPAPVAPAPQPVQPAPVNPIPVSPTAPIVPEVMEEPVAAEPTPLMGGEPLMSEPTPVSEPTPLMETPKPVEKAPEAKPAEGWTCKLCSTHNAVSSKFCKNCGSPKDVQ